MKTITCVLLMFATATAFTTRAPRVLRQSLRSQPLRMIAVGETVPMDGDFMVIDDGPTKVKVSDVFAGKKVVLFGVPGALTPTCSEKHLPGYMAAAADMKAKGVDTIACVSVNDPFVVNAWKKSAEVEGVELFADGAAAWVKAAGLDFDTEGFGGVRCKRMSMLVDDGKVVSVNVEDGGAFTEGANPGSSAEYMLTQL